MLTTSRTVSYVLIFTVLCLSGYSSKMEEEIFAVEFMEDYMTILEANPDKLLPVADDYLAPPKIRTHKSPLAIDDKKETIHSLSSKELKELDRVSMARRNCLKEQLRNRPARRSLQGTSGWQEGSE